jgi:hypothetical protein
MFQLHVLPAGEKPRKFFVTTKLFGWYCRFELTLKMDEVFFNTKSSTICEVFFKNLNKYSIVIFKTLLKCFTKKSLLSYCLACSILYNSSSTVLK